MLLSIHRNGPVARRPGRSRILESDRAPSLRAGLYCKRWVLPPPSECLYCIRLSNSPCWVLPPPSECKQGSTVYGYPTAPAESSWVLPPPSECKQGSTVYGYPTAPAESSPLPRSGEPIMPLHLELVKLSLWQGRDSKPRPSVCNNSELKLQPHTVLP